MLNDIWVKRDNYHWSDEQVVWLIIEICRRHARQTLEAVPPEQLTSLATGVPMLESMSWSVLGRPHVTIPTLQGIRPGKTFVQCQQRAPASAPAAPKPAQQTQQTQVTSTTQTPVGTRTPRLRVRGKKIPVSQCRGKCCFNWRKRSHLIRDCRGEGKCFFVFEAPLPYDGMSQEK